MSAKRECVATGVRMEDGQEPDARPLLLDERYNTWGGVVLTYLKILSITRFAAMLCKA